MMSRCHYWSRLDAPRAWLWPVGPARLLLLLVLLPWCQQPLQTRPTVVSCICVQADASAALSVPLQDGCRVVIVNLLRPCAASILFCR